MEFKYNTKQRTKTIQGLRSFKDTLPKKIKKILNKKGHIYSETLKGSANPKYCERFMCRFYQSYMM